MQALGLQHVSAAECVENKQCDVAHAACALCIALQNSARHIEYDKCCMRVPETSQRHSNAQLTTCKCSAYNVQVLAFQTQALLSILETMARNANITVCARLLARQIMVCPLGNLKPLYE